MNRNGANKATRLAYLFGFIEPDGDHISRDCQPREDLAVQRQTTYPPDGGGDAPELTRGTLETETPALTPALGRSKPNLLFAAGPRASGKAFSLSVPMMSGNLLEIL